MTTDWRKPHGEEAYQERRKQMAEACSLMSDAELGRAMLEVVVLMLEQERREPLIREVTLAQMEDMVRDIRAGESLRLQRLREREAS